MSGHNEPSTLHVYYSRGAGVGITTFVILVALRLRRPHFQHLTEIAVLASRRFQIEDQILICKRI
jgi:hypothetical protein